MYNRFYCYKVVIKLVVGMISSRRLLYHDIMINMYSDQTIFLFKKSNSYYTTNLYAQASRVLKLNKQYIIHFGYCPKTDLFRCISTDRPNQATAHTRLFESISFWPIATRFSADKTLLCISTRVFVCVCQKDE